MKARPNTKQNKNTDSWHQRCFSSFYHVSGNSWMPDFCRAPFTSFCVILVIICHLTESENRIRRFKKELI